MNKILSSFVFLSLWCNIIYAGHISEYNKPDENQVIPSGCTVITISKGGAVFFGGNDDYINPDSYYWVEQGDSESRDEERPGRRPMEG